MAMAALAIDLMLSSFPEIRADLGLRAGDPRVTQTITAVFFGLAVGQIPWGIVADRFGRLLTIRSALAIVIVGASASALAPSFTALLAARFLWGLGAAGCRIGATATVRDSYAGERMAREMSVIMAVFVLVPVFAPTIGAAIASVGSWRSVFWAPAGAAVVLFLWSFRLRESLDSAKVQPLSVASVRFAISETWHAMATRWLLITMCFQFVAFNTYLLGSQLIFDEVYGLKDRFPLIFGGLACLLGAVMLTNGRLLSRFGLFPLIVHALRLFLISSAGILVLALAFDGKPPLLLFLPVLALFLAGQGVLIPNSSAAALRPLGHVAGTAAAIIGTTTTLAGAFVGALIVKQFDGTLTPLAVGMFSASVVAVVCALRAKRYDAETGGVDHPHP